MDIIEELNKRLPENRQLAKTVDIDLWPFETAVDDDGIYLQG